MKSDLIHNNIECIWNILTSRSFRYGSKPNDDIKQIVCQRIAENLLNDQPIRVFQFWGGAKNPNLNFLEADKCELTALNFLSELNEQIKKVYEPGLSIIIFPGDERIHKANLVPRENTQIYVKKLTEYASDFRSLFIITPVSQLYLNYADDFNKALVETEKVVADTITQQPGFENLARNAEKNIYLNRNIKKEELDYLSKQAAQKYIIYRIAEEKARIFRGYEDCIRFAFVRLNLFLSFYRLYLNDLDHNYQHMKRSLHFYTGYKGNITQPWQAVAYEQKGKVYFISQNRSIDSLPKLQPKSS